MEGRDPIHLDELNQRISETTEGLVSQVVSQGRELITEAQHTGTEVGSFSTPVEKYKEMSRQGIHFCIHYLFFCVVVTWDAFVMSERGSRNGFERSKR